MEVGKRIKEARLASGLSQRQLCGDVITRNMLSLIESGKAKPSMDTLAFLAERLGKPMGYFLDGIQESSGTQQVAYALAARCGEVLERLDTNRDAGWYFLRGQVAFALGEYARAADFLSRAEENFPDECVPALEVCYRELGDFKKAYEYACKQKN